jgi:hypothetical protein
MVVEEVKDEGVYVHSFFEEDLVSLANVLKCLNDANHAEDNLMFFHGEIKITDDREDGGVPCGHMKFDGEFWTFTPSILREFDAVPAAETTESDGAK